MCTLDDSGNIVDVLMGDGDSGSASQMFPCSDLEQSFSAAEIEQSEQEAEELAASNAEAEAARAAEAQRAALADRAMESAIELKKTMKGRGTREAAFNHITRTTSREEKEMIKQIFSSEFGEGETLEQWIKGEFSFGAEDKALKAWGYAS